MNEENGTAMAEDKEIDLLELAAKLWRDRRKIILWTCIAAVIAIIISFSIPKEYTASAKLAPEISGDQRSGGISAIASMAGILGSRSGDAVNPELYPDIVGSIPFVTSLFGVEVKTAEGGYTLTLNEYMKTLKDPWWDDVLGAPGKLIQLFKKSEEQPARHELDNFRLTKGEYMMVKAISSRIHVNVNKVNDVITITVEMQDPLVSAMVADTVVNRLQEYITVYRTDKARKDLEYAEKINAEAKQEYYRAQKALADYSDRNQGIATQSARIARDRLENESQLAFTLYNQTAQRVQAAKALVQEKTPVYAIVTPPTVPIAPSSPRKMFILVGFMLLGVFACCVWILFVAPNLSERKKARE